LASDLGHLDIARQVRQSQPGLETEKYYDDENLTRTRSNALDKL
jgi:hypothetical protein